MQYVNSCQVAFWDDKEFIGQFGGAEEDPNHIDDPSRQKLVTRGKDYKECMRSMMALAHRAEVYFAEEVVQSLMHEAGIKDAEGPVQGEVYLGLIVATVH